MILLIALSCVITGYKVAKPVIKIKRIILGGL